MPPKQSTPPPIDRPLSRAYLRQFVGWSTAYPPGQSEPNSLRLMENMLVDRNGALEVRPGLRHLSYTAAATAMGLPVVGSPELFYMSDGSRALLFAVREASGRVGFRAALSTQVGKVVFLLTDPEVGFSVPQGDAVLSFDPGTTHVKYLQINNRILALSDNGEPARMFFVGNQKLAKKLKAVSVPEWADAQKLAVVHPDAAWINAQAATYRSNTAMNPSFEIGTGFWSKSPTCSWRTVDDSSSVPGGRALEIESAPTRTNMEPSPLHDMAGAGYAGWTASEHALLSTAGPMMQVAAAQEGVEFLAVGPQITEGVKSDAEFRVALDCDSDPGAAPIAILESFSADGRLLGTQILDISITGGRWTGPVVRASTGAVTLRLSLGGRRGPIGAAVRFSNVVVCAGAEDGSMFHGSSGANYFWTGLVNQSASVYHPPVDVWVRSHVYAVPGGTPTMAGSIALKKMTASAITAEVSMLLYTTSQDAPAKEVEEPGPATNVAVGASWTRYGATAATAATTVSSSMQVKVTALPRGEQVRLDSALTEAAASSAGVYFDGSSFSTSTKRYTWRGGMVSSLPHEGPSTEATLPAQVALAAEAPTTKTLVATGGASANTYKMGFFYTIENDIGESAASRITELRMSRPWSNWVWELPNAAGEPGGTYSADPTLIADQLVITMPQTVYDQAVRENALRWNLYVMAWSDQEPVPVVAQQVASQDIFPDQATQGGTPLPYSVAGYIQLTASRRAGTDDTVLPTAGNRVNSSIPPSHRNGIVAGDRMVLVGSPDQPATIAWSSSSPGRYTIFTPNKGGGQKTLTSGNLNLPYAVALWQNPQSVDTLTILCADDNGRSTSHYMQPANIQAGNTGAAAIMGFEETTSTPGTVAPFGAEVLNNALYRPLSRSLMKSTASNYNLNHKTQTDKIANMWLLLDAKRRMVSAQLDNRLYYLVHNPRGELLLPGCRGNEIWVLDTQVENGPWSRLLIQGSAMKPITIGAQTFLSVSTPDGIYYLDEESALDDYVDLEGRVQQRPIPWRFETNTQGANRAHDAWAHLQQVGVVLGNFQGSMIYGVRGRTLHGTVVDAKKVFTDLGAPAPTGQRWDVEDILLVRRDMKEWYLYASSFPDRQGTGQIGVVQYRYTPVTVNVGYEFGSVETFEYGADAGNDGSVYSRNGIPLPSIDYARP